MTPAGQETRAVKAHEQCAVLWLVAHYWSSSPKSSSIAERGQVCPRGRFHMVCK